MNFHALPSQLSVLQEILDAGVASSVTTADGTTLQYVEPLGIPSVARQQAVTVVSANVVLTSTVRRISIKARSCDMRYSVGTIAQVANATTSHFIEAGERLDIAVPLNANIAVIRDTAAAVNGTLCVTELT
jgi:hypothetical protein